MNNVSLRTIKSQQRSFCAKIHAKYEIVGILCPLPERERNTTWKEMWSSSCNIVNDDKLFNSNNNSNNQRNEWIDLAKFEELLKWCIKKKKRIGQTKSSFRRIEQIVRCRRHRHHHHKAANIIMSSSTNIAPKKNRVYSGNAR